MASLFAPTALLPDGWSDNVRVSVDRDGKIATVEPAAVAQADDHMLTDRLLLPAPANLHSHAFQRAMAGITEARGPTAHDSFWTWRDVMYQFLNQMDPSQIEAVAALVYVEMLEAGYASVGEFHYVHHDVGGNRYQNPAQTSVSIFAAAAQTGIGLTHLPVLYAQGGVDGRPLTGGQLRFGNDLNSFEALLDAARAGLAGLPADCTMGVAPHSLRAVPPHLLDQVSNLTSGPIHIHIAEQLREVAEIEVAYGARPVAWLLSHTDVNARWTAIHATHMTPAETEGLAQTGAVAGLCPMTEANLGDGIFDAARFTAAGGRYGIGSDCNVRIALSEELRTLEYSQRYRHHQRAVLAQGDRSTGRAMYEMILQAGSQALARSSGAIAAGRWADLLTLDQRSLTLAGCSGDDCLDAWIFSGDDQLVSDVWSAGRHQVQAGRHIARGAVEQRYRACLASLRANSVSAQSRRSR